MNQVRITFNDNSGDVLSMISANVSRALTAMGTVAVGLIVRTMQRAYWRPIWLTGDLQRDVNYEVHDSEHAVDVGNSLNYAPYVHDGTSRMRGRPYITDALTSASGTEAIRSAAENALMQGF